MGGVRARGGCRANGLSLLIRFKCFCSNGRFCAVGVFDFLSLSVALAVSLSFGMRHVSPLVSSNPCT